MGKIKGSFATSYDRFVKRASLLPEGLLWLLKELGAREILEFGCGTGNVAVGLAIEGYCVTGVDYSKDMLDAARRKAVKHKVEIDYYLDDISRVNIARKFDLILCLGNIIPQFTSVSSLRRVLENATKHLKPGGHMLIQQLNYERILAERPMTFSIDQDGNVVRFKQYRYRGKLIDFVVTIVDGDTVPPTTVSSRITLSPWRKKQLVTLFKGVGFKRITAFANYKKDRFSKSSKDLILLAQT